MSTIAYDSARPRLIPAGAGAVFPYCDGHYSWSHLEFPHARYRYITVLGDPDADIADVEPGCMSVAGAVTWALERKARGHTDLTVYVDRDLFPSVRHAFAERRLSWHLFLTTLDGSKPASYDGMHVRAVQYTDRNGAFDESLVYDEGWLNPP